MISSGAHKLALTGVALVGVLLVAQSSSGTFDKESLNAEILPTTNSALSEIRVFENGKEEIVNLSDFEKSVLLHGGEASPQNISYTLDNTSPPALSAYAALAADLLSSQIYFGSNTAKRWPLASLTKLMTAKIAFETLPLYETVELVDAHFSKEETITPLKAGERYRIIDLMTAMLISSSNEGAEALASVLGREDFIRRMNGTARAWGLAETFFSDPTGLSVSNQTTAENLLMLAAKLYAEYPEIFKITREQKITLTEMNSGTPRTFTNIHVFSRENDFLGGKTGFTDEAKGNLLSLFNVNGKPTLIIVLGTEDRFGESSTLLSWFHKRLEIQTQ